MDDLFFGTTLSDYLGETDWWDRSARRFDPKCSIGIFERPCLLSLNQRLYKKLRDRALLGIPIKPHGHAERTRGPGVSGPLSCAVCPACDRTTSGLSLFRR
jgi:hypothetical protein